MGATMDFEAMKRLDVQTVDPDSLVDIRNVFVHTDLKGEERVQDFIRQIKNPYCFRYGEMVIKLEFEDTDITFMDRLQEYVRRGEEE